jgi:hypothetical protein
MGIKCLRMLIYPEDFSLPEYFLKPHEWSVDHGGLEFLMAEQFLNRPNLRAIMPIIESILNNKSGIIR